MTKDKKNITWFIIILLISLLIFFPWLLGHLGGDDYKIAEMEYNNYIKQYSLNDGRIFCALLLYIYGLLKLPIEVSATISLVLAIIICSISVVYLKNVIEEYKSCKNLTQEIILTLICFFTIFNFMQIDALYYIEAPLIEMGILICLITANLVSKNEKGKLIKALLWTILGVFCYQGTIVIFIALTFLFSIFNSKNSIKRIILNIIETVSLIGIAYLANKMFISIYGNIMGLSQNRISISIESIIHNIKIIIKYIDKLLLYNYSYFSTGIFLFLLFMLSILVLVYLYITKKKDTLIFKLITIFAVFVICNEIFPIITLSSFGAGRLNVLIGMIIGSLYSYIYIESDMLINKSIIKYISVLLLIVYRKFYNI